MNAKNSGYIVDLQVTGRCNMNCDFCCGSDKGIKDRDYETVSSVLNKLKKVGTETIVFSGGEPFLRKDIESLVRYSKNLGFRVYFSTNGLLFFKKYPQIKNYINCLGIPLDGSINKINVNMGRNTGMFDNNLEILRYFWQNPPTHMVKVGTLVSKVNMEDIVNIGKVFKNNQLQVPDVWRLYQFTPIKKGKLSKEKHEISDFDFYSLCKRVKKEFSDLKISCLSNDDSDNSYIFVGPDMGLQILSDNEFVTLGDLTKMDINSLSQILMNNKGLRKKNLSNRGWLNE